MPLGVENSSKKLQNDGLKVEKWRKNPKLAEK